MSIAAAASGVSKSIRQILAEREELRQQQVLEAARQQQIDQESQRIGLTRGRQEADDADRTMRRRTESAGIMAELLGPGVEMSPEQAGTFAGTPYAPLVQEHQELESFTQDPTTGQRQTAPGGRKYITLRPTRQQEGDAGQREGRRKLSDLVKIGAPRSHVLGAMAESGQDINAALMNDPEAAHQRELEQIRATGEETRRTAGVRATATPEQEWVIREGQPVPIPKGTARAGDKPYDPVAARSAQPTNTAEAVDTAREVQRIARSLRTHEGLPGTFGVVSARMPTMRQSTADAETLLNSLQGLLTIENMGKMKGVLSDADMRILRQASTTLDAKMSEPAARAELLRLERVMSKLTGDPADDIAPPDVGGRASGAGPAGGSGQSGAIRYDMNGNPTGP